MATANCYPDLGYVGGDANAQTTLLDSAVPDVLSTWQGFQTLTAGELADLASSGGTGVECEQYFNTDDFNYYAGGVLTRVPLQAGTTTQLDVRSDVTQGGSGSNSFELYVWDFATGSFGSRIASVSGGPPSTTQQLTATISSGLSDLISGNVIWLLTVTRLYSSDPTKVNNYVTALQTYTPASGGIPLPLLLMSGRVL